MKRVLEWRDAVAAGGQVVSAVAVVSFVAMLLVDFPP
jgi:hypothetical protein